MWTKRTIAAVSVAGLAAAGVAGVAVATGTPATTAPAGVLDDLVEEEVISEQERDSFEATLDAAREWMAEKREERALERQQRWDELAQAAGTDRESMVEALRDGQSLAEIAGEENVEAVRALLRERELERIATAQERLDERTANVEENVESILQGELGERWGGWGERLREGLAERLRGAGGLLGGPDA